MEKKKQSKYMQKNEVSEDQNRTYGAQKYENKQCR